MEPKNKFQFIQVGVDISNTVRATLGPRGMNKMVINSDNDMPILTNDGATIIRNLALSHPIGKVFKNLAESQEKAIGDGTTTTTILAGQLLESALTLLNKNVHPVTIIAGYNIARNEALKFTKLNSFEVPKEQIMLTTFGSKISPEAATYLTELLKDIDLENLRIAKIENASVEDTRIINGYVVDGFTINERMPSHAEGKIAVLELQNNMEFAKFNITSTEELDKVDERQRDFKKNIVKKLVEADVKVLFYTDTNPQFESYLTEAGIMGIVVYKRDIVDFICKSTGAIANADPTSDFKQFTGVGKVNYDKEKGGVFIINETSPIKTLILAGPTKQVLEETERAVDDVVNVLKHIDKAVAGGGAFEIELSKHLKSYAANIGGKEQVAVERFADAIEAIPLILAENCGFDAMEVLSILKSKHLHGDKFVGVDPDRLISDVRERGIYEPQSLKLHAINSATDVANLILKLDDIYSGEKEGK